MGVYSATEVKFENGINRTTAVANPRQIERVIRGSVFDLRLVYEYAVADEEEEEILEDIALLAEGMKLLQYDYLGGHGSRGYGGVKFKELHLAPVVGTLNESLLQALL